MFPKNSERLIGISDAFSAFCLLVPVIFLRCSLYPQQKQAYYALHPQAWTYIIIQVYVCRHLLSAFPWISEDRQLAGTRKTQAQYNYTTDRKQLIPAVVMHWL